jgi:nucleotide-binding universal stress UspA family protein
MSTNTGTILVGYDGSPDADIALQWAAETAALAGHVVRAVMVDEGKTPPGAPPGWEPDDKIPAQVDAVLAAAGASGTAERHVGNVESILLQQAREADMLVFGSRGHGWAAQTFLGSVSQHLARHAPCPVVVVRKSANPDAGRIVVGLDGSEESIAALRFACQRARLTNESVVALHAWKPGPVQLDHRGQLPDALADRSEAAEAALAEYVLAVHADHPTVTIERESVAMAPGLALTEASTNASLVVTGSRGHGALAGLLLGSVSHRVLLHAQCPVAVVR